MAEAPPVITSMRWMLADGSMFRSTAFEKIVPDGARRPLIRTSERLEPRFRRLIRFRPDEVVPEKVDWVRDPPNEGANWGRLTSTSLMFSSPCDWRRSWPTTWTGVAESRFGRWMREPVTTSSSTATSSWAIAGTADSAAAKAPINIVDAKRRPRLVVRFKILFLQRARSYSADEPV